MNSARELTEYILAHRSEDAVYMVGIDGAGGSGKSTLSEELCSMISANGTDCEIFHIDDFIHPRAVRYNDEYPQWEQYYYLQWRYDYFMENVALPLRRDGELSRVVELYDKENDSYLLKSADIRRGSIVITEGVFLQREELRGAFDLMVYMDIPKEVRLERVLRRDGYIGDTEAILRKYEDRYFPAEDKYAGMNDPQSFADIIYK